MQIGIQKKVMGHGITCCHHYMGDQVLSGFKLRSRRHDPPVDAARMHCTNLACLRMSATHLHIAVVQGDCCRPTELHTTQPVRCNVARRAGSTLAQCAASQAAFAFNCLGGMSVVQGVSELSS
jgi:hypothetical protein